MHVKRSSLGKDETFFHTLRDPGRTLCSAGVGRNFPGVWPAVDYTVGGLLLKIQQWTTTEFSRGVASSGLHCRWNKQELDGTKCSKNRRRFVEKPKTSDSKTEDVRFKNRRRPIQKPKTSDSKTEDVRFNSGLQWNHAEEQEKRCHRRNKNVYWKKMCNSTEDIQGRFQGYKPSVTDSTTPTSLSSAGGSGLTDGSVTSLDSGGSAFLSRHATQKKNSGNVRIWLKAEEGCLHSGWERCSFRFTADNYWWRMVRFALTERKHGSFLQNQTFFSDSFT